MRIADYPLKLVCARSLSLKRTATPMSAMYLMA
jgi:hypothetical protein